MGQLIFRYGTMGSGKSLDLITRVYHEKSKGNNVWVWKPEQDTKSSKISTRAGLSCEVDYLIEKENNDFSNLNIEFGRIFLFIDEAQFLTRNQVSSLAIEASISENSIFCYGLKTDFQTRLFEGSKRLLEIANKIEEIEHTCQECENKAIFNMRLEQGKPIFSGDSILIGGDETYKPVCSKCYWKEWSKE